MAKSFTVAIRGSQFPSVHRTTSPALASGLRKLPAWVQAAEQLTQLTSYSAPVGGDDVDDLLAEEIREALEAGQGVPEDIITRAAAITGHNEAIERVGRALMRAQTSLTVELDEAVTAGAAELYGHLNGELHQVLQDTRALLPKLGGVRDAETAIDAGKVDAWSAFTELSDRFAGVRTAQLQLMRDVTRSVTHEAPPEAYLEHALDIYPEVNHAPRGGWVHPAGGNKDPYWATPPWPDEWHTPEALLWAVENPEAGAWVATPQQMVSARQRIVESTSQQHDLTTRRARGSLTVRGPR